MRMDRLGHLLAEGYVTPQVRLRATWGTPATAPPRHIHTGRPWGDPQTSRSSSITGPIEILNRGGQGCKESLSGNKEGRYPP
jgi:hypothetical protein